jgi:type IV pilus assembly protein PilB
MGVEFFLLASSLQVVAAQRLVRCICENCRAKFVLTEMQKKSIQELFNAIQPKEIIAYGLDPKQPIVFYHGKGCDKCGQTGYHGRVAVYEVIEVDDELRAIISDHKANETEVRKAALRQGMVSMKQDGILKALKGITTLAEIERVTEGKILVDEE